MNFKYAISLLVIACFFENVCMESILERNNTVVIIDRNRGDELPLTQQSLIGVFGSTPRYSAYVLYTETLKKHSSTLIQAALLGKRLKGFPKKTKQFIESFRESIGLDAFKKLSETKSAEECMHLFFAAGFNREILQNNIKLLLETADTHLKEISKSITSNTAPCLVHIFVPSYFADSVELKNNPEMLYSFLCKSAHLYKEMYDVQSYKTNIPVYIVIPRMEFFTTVLSSGLDSLTQNLAMVKNNLMTESCAGCVLIDQNSENLAAMVNTLRDDGITNVAGCELPITNSNQRRITIFNPYLIKPGVEIPCNESPLFTDTLKKVIQQLGNNNA